MKADSLYSNYIFTTSSDADSLIMLRNHIDMVPNFTMATSKTVYIWIQNKQKRETAQFKAKLKKMQQKLGQTIYCVSTNEQADNYIKRYTNCRQKIIKIGKKSSFKEIGSDKEKQNPEEVKDLFSNNNIKDKYEIKDINVKQKDEQGMLKLLKDNKEEDNEKDLPNFITLKSQVGSSNVLVKSMIAMINQRTNQETRTQLVNTLRYSLNQVRNTSPNLNKDWLQVDCFLIDLQLQKKLSISKSIKWYTCKSIIHSFVNNFLRIVKHPTQIFYIQPYFQDLFNSISSLYENQKEVKQRRKFVCFRGGKIAKEQIQLLVQNKGEVVQNLGFLSTSLDLETANKFRDNVVFKIYVDYQPNQAKLNYGYAFLEEISARKGQNQVLFNPLNSFKLVTIQQKPTKDGKPAYYQVVLQYGILGKYLAKKQQELNEDQKVYRTLASIQKNQKSQIQSQGHALIDQKHQLVGSKQYWEVFYQRAVKIENKKLILQGLLYKTICLKHSGNYNQAKKLYSKYHQMVIQNYGQENIKYADSLSNLAFIYKLLQQPEIALDFYYKSLKLKEKLLGKDSVSYALSLSSIAIIYRDKSQFMKSLQFFQQSLEILQNKLGQMHSYCVGNINNIATVHESCGNMRQAKVFYMKSLQLQEKLVGRNHPQYAAALHNVGRIQKSLGQLQLAKQKLQICEKLKKKLLGQMHPDYALSLQSLAGLYIKNSQFDQAIFMLKTCLNIQRQCFGQNNLKYAATLVNLGIAYLRQGKLSPAKNCFMQSLKIQQNSAGTEHLDYASTLINLAIVYKLNDQLDQCLKIAKQSNLIVQKVLKDDDHYFLIEGLNLIADVYEKKKMYVNSIRSYNHAYKVLQKRSDANIQQKIQIKQKIGDLLYKVQNYHQSLQFYEECHNLMKAKSYQNKQLNGRLQQKIRKTKKKI